MLGRFAEYIGNIYSLFVYSLVQIAYLLCILLPLSSSLYQGSVASISQQKQHITVLCCVGCLSLFIFAFCPLHFTCYSASTEYLFPDACWIFFLWLQCVRMHWPVLNTWISDQKLKFFRMFTVTKGWKCLKSKIIYFLCDVLLAFVQHPDCNIYVIKLSSLITSSPWYFVNQQRFYFYLWCHDCFHVVPEISSKLSWLITSSLEAQVLMLCTTKPHCQYRFLTEIPKWPSQSILLWDGKTKW